MSLPIATSPLQPVTPVRRSNVECVELLLARGAKPTNDMLLAAFDEARLACLLSHGCQPLDIPTFLHACIRSKGFVHPDLDSKRFPPVIRQQQRHDVPKDDPINNAKKAAVAHVERASKQGCVCCLL